MVTVVNLSFLHLIQKLSQSGISKLILFEVAFETSGKGLSSNQKVKLFQNRGPFGVGNSIKNGVGDRGVLDHSSYWVGSCALVLLVTPGLPYIHIAPGVAGLSGYKLINLRLAKITHEISEAFV